VPVCLATPVVDPYAGLNLPAGQVTLVGADALAFVRSRHGVGDGSDLGRISNQQLFLSALMRKITSAGVLSNPLTMFSLAHAAVSNMQLSDTLTSPTTMVAIALALKNVSLSNIVFLQFPSITDPIDPNRVAPDVSAAQVLTTALQADQPVTLTGAVGRAAVLSPGASASPAPTAPAPAPTATQPGSTSPPAGTPSATPAPSAVALPSNVTGQTAAEQTCTKGN
jgi:anionic cell wall polymer biosynthesis LytR-Cps2A-Psr (LCP) family protein